MRDRMVDAFVAIMQPSPTVFVVGGFIVILVPIILHFFLASRTNYTILPSILLAGPSGGGKTALTVLLERGGGTSRQTQALIEVPPTSTSVVEHSVELGYSDSGDNTSNDAVNDQLNRHHSNSTQSRFILHDTPGYENRRYLALDYIFASVASRATPSSKLKAVVFVIDSAAMGDDTTDIIGGASYTTMAAEYLYDVLVALQKRSSGKKLSRAPPVVSVLVAANKQDLFTAHTPELVRSSLETELSRIRSSRSKGMLESGVGSDDLDIDDKLEASWLGAYATEKFTFDQMREFDVEVDIIGGSVVAFGAIGSASTPGVEKWWKWIIDRV